MPVKMELSLLKLIIAPRLSLAVRRPPLPALSGGPAVRRAGGSGQPAARGRAAGARLAGGAPVRRDTGAGLVAIQGT